MALTTYNITGSLKDALGGTSLIGEVTFAPFGTHDARVDGSDALLGPIRYSIADLPATIALSAGGWVISIRSTGRINGDQQFKTITRTLDLVGALTWGDIVAGAVSSPPMTPTLVEEAQAARDEAEVFAAQTVAMQDTAVKTLVDDPASATRASLSATYGAKIDLLTGAFADELWVAHRVGGNQSHPEQSVEGIAHSFEFGFAAEVDIQPLADGTLVLNHDATADRTTTLTGNVNTLTPAQWRAGRLKPVITGGRKLPLPFWDEVLDTFGGRGIFYAEIKTNDNTAAQAVIDSIVKRGLEKSVVIVTFNSTHVQMASAAGLQAMFVSDTTSPATVAGWGAIGQGVTLSVSQSFVDSILATGMVAGVYGLTTKAEADARKAWGVRSFTADDPWWLTDRYTARDKDPLADMAEWVGLRSDSTATKYVPYPDGSVALRVTSGSVRMPWTGPIARGSRILATWTFGTTGGSSVSQRFYLGTTKDLHGTNYETATDNWYLIFVRRSGELVVYKRVAGVATALTGTGTANPLFPVLADGAAGADMRLQIDLLSTGIEVTNLNTGGKRVYADTALAGPFYLNASMGGGTTQGDFRNIMRHDV